MIASKTYRLADVYDLREVDFESGKRVPLRAGEGNECHRCRRLHAKVFVVEDECGARFHVGSTCCKRAFEGWYPEAAELKSARKRDRERVAAKREAKLLAAAEVIAAKIALVPFEPMALLEEREGYEVWGGPRTSIWIHGWMDQSRTETMRERAECYRNAWIRTVAKELAPEASHEVIRAASNLATGVGR